VGSLFYLCAHLFFGNILTLVTTKFLAVGWVDLCGTHFDGCELACVVHDMKRADSAEVSRMCEYSGMSWVVFGILE